jgi:hypothetical protein
VKTQHSIEVLMAGERACVISLGINGPIPDDHPKVLFQAFPSGLKRIHQDLILHGFKGDFIFWDEKYPNGAPLQADVHGAFKPFCFLEAIAAGYSTILWFDASIRVLMPIEPLLESINDNGYLIFEAPETVGEYCADSALGPLGITREQSFKMRSCWSCVLGLDLRTDRAKEFLNRWKACALDGITFRGPKWSGVRGWPMSASTDERVRGHRYDQTAASVIAMQLGMNKWCSRTVFDQYFKNDRLSVRRLQEWKNHH